jgi:RND family efflux transporter MFP subunit
MKNVKFSILVLSILIVGGIGGYFIYTFAPMPTSGAKPVILPVVPYIEVTISSRSIPVYSRGRVQAASVHKITSQVSGLVTNVSPLLKKGAQITEGELLAQIDEQPLILDIAQRKATLSQTKLRLEETQANARVARKQTGRNASDYARFVPQLEYANSQVEAAQAAVDYAYTQLEEAKITAPISGKVLDTFIDEGDLVQTGSPIAVINSMNDMEIRLPLNDRELIITGANKTGSDNDGPVSLPEVYLTDFESKDRWKGYIVRTDGMRSQNQLLYVIAQVRGDNVFSDMGRRLVPGSFVEADIRGREIDDLRVMPRDVLQPEDSIWVISPDNHIQRQEVSVVYRGRDSVYIETRLPPGTKVVSGGFHRLIEGMEVRPTPATDAVK